MSQNRLHNLAPIAKLQDKHKFVPAHTPLYGTGFSAVSVIKILSRGISWSDAIVDVICPRDCRVSRRETTPL